MIVFFSEKCTNEILEERGRKATSEILEERNAERFFNIPREAILEGAMLELCSSPANSPITASPSPEPPYHPQGGLIGSLAQLPALRN